MIMSAVNISLSSQTMQDSNDFWTCYSFLGSPFPAGHLPQMRSPQHQHQHALSRNKQNNNKNPTRLLSKVSGDCCPSLSSMGWSGKEREKERSTNPPPPLPPPPLPCPQRALALPRLACLAACRPLLLLSTAVPPSWTLDQAGSPLVSAHLW